jgi:hypothetical protein
MPEEPPVPTDEQSALRSIAALINKYEPRFDLRRSFTPGVIGCSDPQYPMVRREWLRDLDRKGLTSKAAAVFSESVIDHFEAESELGWQKYQPADSRFNWRVTVRHGNYFIHIMAVDKTFERFAFSLQTEGAVEAGFTSGSPRPSCQQYKVVNHLSELKPVFDDLYESFNRQDQEERTKERINKAVTEERDRWVKRLDADRTKRQQVGFLVAFVVVVCVIVAVNDHFRGVPGNIVGTALGAGIVALFGAAFFFWGLVWLGSKFSLNEEGKATHRTTRTIITSTGVAFFGLWAILAYWMFTG